MRAATAEFARLSALLVLEFIVVFYGADWIAGERSMKLRVNFAWESDIPFFQPAYVIYFSVFLLPFAIPLVIRDPREIRQWALRMAVAIAVAGAVFVAFPAQIGYPPQPEGWLSALARTVCGTYNLLPSLHVALTVVIVWALWPHLRGAVRWLTVLWACALVLSTLATHQHHVLDVIAGLLLGAAVSGVRLRAS